jgi:thiamine biosynthesis lipoprotein
MMHAAQDFIMDTTVEQRVFAENAQAICEKATALLHRIESLMSFFNPGSDIRMLNDSAGLGAPVPLDADTLRVLAAAQEYCAVSGGAFDITAAPLIDCWRRESGLRGKHGPGSGMISADSQTRRIPSETELGRAMALVGNRNLRIDPAKRTAMLAKKGCAVDLGGIAKGYAADLVIGLYKAEGAQSALVNLGGNVKTLGRKPDGKPWVVGLQHPEKARGEFFGTVSVENAAVATSGGYERFVEIDAVKYHHILDPRTGYPSASDLVSVTVISPESMRADALATAIFILGRERGRLLLERYPGSGAVLMDENMDVSTIFN